ncbi:HNH endonuclease, partial [Pseudofrankia sp. BMG5.37]|nr:HNH endonuclease [Pseudofrankia sp. BMG5.37]
DSRPIGARRADVLTALLLGNRRERVTVEIQVIAPVGTLAGLDDNPTELVGHGPIPAHIGRTLAADARWRRVLTDPATGTVLDLGHRRVPTPALARLVRHRDTRCVYPGCAMPATACDLDHTLARTTNGHTALDNLGTLCRRHHVMKHSPGWQLHQPEPGTFIWITPTGRTHHVNTTTNDEEGFLPEEDPHTWTTNPAATTPDTQTRTRNPPGSRPPADNRCPF